MLCASVQMTAGYCANCRDDVIYRCHACWRKTSARTGNLFVRSKLTIRQIMVSVVNWIVKAPVTVAATSADVTEASVVQWFK